MITTDTQLLLIVAIVLAIVATLAESVVTFIKLKREYPIYFYDTHLKNNWVNYLGFVAFGSMIMFGVLLVVYRLYFNSH